MQRSLPPRRRRTAITYASRHLGKLIGTWWVALIAADTFAAFTVIAWLPNHIHALLLAGALTASVAALLHRRQIPVRAAFLDGMLYEREHGYDIPLPQASGDDTGGAKVMTFQRQPGSHRPRPAPRPRRQP